MESITPHQITVTTGREPDRQTDRDTQTETDRGETDRQAGSQGKYLNLLVVCRVLAQKPCWPRERWPAEPGEPSEPRFPRHGVVRVSAAISSRQCASRGGPFCKDSTNSRKKSFRAGEARIHNAASQKRLFCVGETHICHLGLGWVRRPRSLAEAVQKHQSEVAFAFCVSAAFFEPNIQTTSFRPGPEPTLTRPVWKAEGEI